MAKKITETKLTVNKGSDTLFAYNVFNRLTGSRSIFFSENEIQALKTFQKTVNSQPVNDPEDFELHLIGTWNKKDGSISSLKHSTIAIGKWEKQLDREFEPLVYSMIEKYLENKKKEGK